MRFWLFLLAAAGCAVAANAQESAATGIWSGVLSRDGGDVRATLRIDQSANPPTAVLSANDLRIVDYPMRNLSISGDRITFELTGDASTTRFEGHVANGRLSGTMNENGRLGTFAMRRETANPASPCEARPAAFANGRVTLRGTLLRPRRGPARPPAVVLVHGSGPESRDAGRFLATALCRGGAAALIYDKRGVGASTGDWRNATFEDLAGDAVAALSWLAAQPDVDPRRLGLYGHSQGGALLPMIANRSQHVAFLVAGAGAGIPMSGVERFSLRNAVAPLARDAADAADASAYVDRLIAAAGSGTGIPQFIADAQRFRDRRWFEVVAPPPADAPYWRFARAIFGYDPAREWRRIRQPAMFLYGERDERIPVEASIAANRAALQAAGNRHFTIAVLPGASHAFNLSAAGQPWPRVAAGYPDLIVAFVLDPANAASRRASQRSRAMRAR